MLSHLSLGEGKVGDLRCCRVWSDVVDGDGRTGYTRPKGREYTAGKSVFAEPIWYNLPKTADLTMLDDR